MARIMLLLIMLTWPWKMDWVPSALSIGIEWRAPDGKWPCKAEAIACYSAGDEAMFLSPRPGDLNKAGGMTRVVFHELLHHLQFESGIFREHRWEEFRADVADFILYEGHDLSDHQRATLRYHMVERSDELWELHAELPAVLEGEIPCGLAPWYPWFELQCEEEDVNDEGIGGRALQKRHDASHKRGLRALDAMERRSPDRYHVPHRWRS